MNESGGELVNTNGADTLDNTTDGTGELVDHTNGSGRNTDTADRVERISFSRFIKI